MIKAAFKTETLICSASPPLLLDEKFGGTLSNLLWIICISFLVIHQKIKAKHTNAVIEAFLYFLFEPFFMGTVFHQYADFIFLVSETSLAIVFVS